MTHRLLALLALFPTLAFAGVLEIGDPVPGRCWKNEVQQPICLTQSHGMVQVLIFGSGWCPDCKRETRLLMARLHELKGKAVSFFALMAEGDQKGVAATPEFLKSWRLRYNIPFPVLFSPRDVGKDFHAPPIYIPNVAVVGRDGKLAYKAFEPSIDDLFREIRKALGETESP